jgi:hypothetical protein
MNGFYSNHMGLLGFLANDFRSAAQLEPESERFAHLADQVERLMTGLEEVTGSSPAIHPNVPA